MKKFIVLVREVYTQPVAISAESGEEALEKVAQGNGRRIKDSLEYVSILDKDTWTVEEQGEMINGNKSGFSETR